MNESFQQLKKTRESKTDFKKHSNQQMKLE